MILVDDQNMRMFEAVAGLRRTADMGMAGRQFLVDVRQTLGSLTRQSRKAAAVPADVIACLLG
jgi:hypothetical protein